MANFGNGKGGLRDGVKFRGGGSGNHSGKFWKLRMVVTCIRQRCIERYLHENIPSLLVYSLNDIKIIVVTIILTGYVYNRN